MRKYAIGDVLEVVKDYMSNLSAPGWTIPETAYMNDEGNIEFTSHDTMWEVDPETGASRHCGIEPECFWTDWE